jgi:hypothetical protein
MGMARPAFTAFKVGRLFTGLRKPAKRYNTETGNEHDAALPALSLAVAIADVVPTGKSDPEDGVAVTTLAEQLSLADGAG